MDPIQREGFSVHRGREANPERMKRIRLYAKRKQFFHDLLVTEVREAILTGHSYRQVAEAAGVSVSSIQRMMLGEN